MQILLFDIDGTLLLSHGVGIRAINESFKELYQTSGDVWKQTKSHGRTDPEILQEIAKRELGEELDPNGLEELKVAYIKHFKEQIKDSPGFEVLSGVMNLLSELNNQDDLIIGLETGNYEAAAWEKLRRGSIDNFFSFGGFACDSSERHEIIAASINRARQLLPSSPTEIYVVGDAPQDMIAGEKNGAITIGVATGTASEEELRKHKAHHTLPNLSDINLFKNLLAR